MSTETRRQLYTKLSGLLPSQLQEIVFLYGLPQQHLPQNNAPAQTAMALIQYAESREGPDMPELAGFAAGIKPAPAPSGGNSVFNQAGQQVGTQYNIAGNANFGDNHAPPPQKPPETKHNPPAAGNAKTPQTVPLKLFYSYSHADEDLRDKLAKHLKILQRQGIIAEWHDRAIDASEDWEHEIKSNMENADIILLLVSADFIASDYCWSNELAWALERHNQGLTKVIPVILRPVDWQDAPFQKLQALPKNAKPVTTWDNTDEAFLNITQGIRRLAQKTAK